MKRLRIFYASYHSPHPNIPSSNLWYNNLYLPLCDLGHEVIPFEYDLSPFVKGLDPTYPEQRALIEEIRPRLEEALLAQIIRAHKEKPIDVFFSYFYAAYARPEVIREIGSMGICTINWYCNGSFQFHLIQDLAPAYHYCLVPEKFRLDDYRRVGANPIYCQEAANPNIYRPYDVPREYDVTFVGQKYGDRPTYIRYLLDAGINVRVWGWGWQPQGQMTSAIRSKSPKELWWLLTRVEGWSRAIQKAKRLLVPQELEPSIPGSRTGPPLDDDALIKMYSRSKVSLGFSSCGETHRSGQKILQVRLRDFEAPMSGAFYMVEHMEELTEFFEPGKEIVCYYDKADLAEKVKYYLAHEAERERIRLAGMRRARSEHSSQNRFARVFAEIGLAA